MQYQHKEQRIYSRPRIDLVSSNGGYRKRHRGFGGFRKKPNFNDNRAKIKQLTPIFIILTIAFITFL